MATAPKKKSWVICSTCKQPNPVGAQFCQHCHKAIRHDSSPISYEEMEEVSKEKLSRWKRKRRSKVVAISLALAAILALPAFVGLYFLTDIVSPPPQNVNSDSLPGDWAMFRHNLNRSGTSDPDGSPAQGTVAWVFPTGGPIYSSPAVSNGIVYIGSQDKKLYALDADTGATVWEYETGSWVDSSPAIVNGVVYFGSNDGRLHALDAGNGEKLWDFNTRRPVTSSPAVADDIVYFGSDDYYIYALDAITGTKLWSFKTDYYVKASPIVVNGIVYIGSMDKHCYTFHALNGRPRLQLDCGRGIVSSPVVSNETAYFITSQGRLYALEADARNWLWEKEIRPWWITFNLYGLAPRVPSPTGLLLRLWLGAPVDSSPALIDNIMYIGVGNKLLAIDIEDQQMLWAFQTEGSVRSSPAVVGKTVYIGSEEGRLYAVDATSGQRLWEVGTDDRITSSPAVADGMIYIGSHDGNLYAIK